MLSEHPAFRYSDWQLAQQVIDTASPRRGLKSFPGHLTFSLETGPTLVRNCRLGLAGTGQGNRSMKTSRFNEQQIAFVLKQAGSFIAMEGLLWYTSGRNVTASERVTYPQNPSQNGPFVSLNGQISRSLGNRALGQIDFLASR
ncbi:MAG TPA: hypothetical protein VF463_13495 [Sphingobium sp.]